MANLPFFRFPYNNYHYHYYPTYNNTNYSDKNRNEKISNINEYSINAKDKTKNNQCFKSYNEPNTKKISSKYNSLGPIHYISPFSVNNLEEPVVEILGIQLYLDDIIILGLLFFLYREGVQDEMLFLSLILLLLT